MAFMISVVHNFVNNDCTTPEKTNPYHCHWKKQLWKYEMKNDLKRKKSSSFNNPALFWYHKKMNNNEKKWIVIKFGLTYLKRTSLCTWKVHIPFLSTTLQNTAQSRAKTNAFFASKIKKLSNNYWPKWFWKKPFWFSSNKYTNLPRPLCPPM